MTGTPQARDLGYVTGRLEFLGELMSYHYYNRTVDHLMPAKQLRSVQFCL